MLTRPVHFAYLANQETPKVLRYWLIASWLRQTPETRNANHGQAIYYKTYSNGDNLPT